MVPVGRIEIGIEIEDACARQTIPTRIKIHTHIYTNTHRPKEDTIEGLEVGVPCGTETGIGIGESVIATEKEIGIGIESETGTGTEDTGCRMDIDGRIVDGIPFPAQGKFS